MQWLEFRVPRSVRERRTPGGPFEPGEGYFVQMQT